MQQKKEKAERMKNAHGLVMGIAFAILFPLGAALVRLVAYKGQIWVHAAWQGLAFALGIAGLGLGIWLAVNTDQVCAVIQHTRTHCSRRPAA